MVNSYAKNLRQVLELHKNEEEAAKMSKYMRNQFEYLGMRAPILRGLVNDFIKENGLPHKDEFKEIIEVFWAYPEREFQIAGLYIMDKMIKTIQVTDLTLLEFMITTKSWWDTVDHLAKHHAGKYFSVYPGDLGKIDDWLGSGNIWLIRSSVLFQLGYKAKTDQELLSSIIIRSLGTKEFFINKAIGWALREYGKTNPDFTLDFVGRYPLSPLSKREALKILHKTI